MSTTKAQKAALEMTPVQRSIRKTEAAVRRTREKIEALGRQFKMSTELLNKTLDDKQSILDALKRGST